MTDPREAIEEYHAALTGEPGLAEECQARLNDELGSRNLYFGSRPLCSVLRPRFLSAGQYDLLRRGLGSLLMAWRNVYRRAMEDEAFRGILRLEPWEEALALEEAGRVEPTSLSRIDCFFAADGSSFKVVEQNAETPAGAAYSDVLADIFLALPVMSAFLRRWELKPLPSRHHVLQALVDAYHRWSGRLERPRIAILDWHEAPTYSEFVISAEYFRARGLECVIADPREVEYRGGKVVAAGAEVDLIYRRVLVSELVERGGMDHPVIRAVRDRAVCMVNPFRCKLASKKATLAVLTDEANAGMFTPAQRQAIAAHVAWTRVVAEGRTRHEGREVDLLEYVADRRDRFVLKPNDGYAGRGVVFGRDVDDAEWRRALDAALETPYVVQERVELPARTYPAFVEGRLELTERTEDTAPFAFHGEYVAGCLTRLATGPIVNVSAGSASSTATFVVSRR